MYHKAESIRWMNKSIRKLNHGAADTTIAGAACLVIFNVSNPSHLLLWTTLKVDQNLIANIPGVKIHIDGLEALVTNRGGLQALPIHGLARKIVTCAWTICLKLCVIAPDNFLLQWQIARPAFLWTQSHASDYPALRTKKNRKIGVSRVLYPCFTSPDYSILLVRKNLVRKP